jgi:hypothetical protein
MQLQAEEQGHVAARAQAAEMQAQVAQMQVHAAQMQVCVYVRHFFFEGSLFFFTQMCVYVDQKTYV